MILVEFKRLGHKDHADRYSKRVGRSRTQPFLNGSPASPTPGCSSRRLPRPKSITALGCCPKGSAERLCWALLRRCSRKISRSEYSHSISTLRSLTPTSPPRGGSPASQSASSTRNSLACPARAALDSRRETSAISPIAEFPSKIPGRTNDGRSQKSRAQARGDADRVAGQIDKIGPEITPESLRRFGKKARAKLRHEDGTFARNYLRSVAQKVIVESKTDAYLHGSKTELLRTLTVASGVEAAVLGVSPGVPKWRARNDSNVRPSDS